jgi:4-amino-4-deoxy-L-arabinose transferase-like glycosyltransferase
LGVRGRVVQLSAFHLLFALIIFCVLPQVLYLASRNITWQWATEPRFFFRVHPDGFLWGSGGGNCGLPGNVRCEPRLPVFRSFQPIHAALLWAALTGWLLWINRHERRVQRLSFLGAWLCLAISTLGKGAPGLVLPVFSLLLFVFATRRWGDLSRLELGGALLLLVTVVLPWFLQMYLRHGAEFTERLLVHDMYKRAFRHVHDTNAGDDVSFRYYVWQLGYGLFPWTGLAAAGLLWWPRLPTGASRRVAEVSALCVLWFVSGFGMFTISLTKFHHYIFPVVPALAVLSGVLLDRLLEGAPLPRGRLLVAYLGGISGAVVLLLGGAVLARQEASGRVGSMVWGLLLIVAGILATMAVVRRWSVRPVSSPSSADSNPTTLAATHQRAMLAVLGLGAAVTVALVGRDLVSNRPGVVGQARLMHLFSYNYDRPWPESLDFTASLAAITVVCAAICALLVLRGWRPHLTVLFLAAAVLSAAWGTNIYLVQASPHWGQRETVLEYYRRRSGPEEWLVAYQMNWKGENFYTGNRLPAFVKTGEEFTKWVRDEKAHGLRVMFFTTEHSRTNGLKSELGKVAKFEVVTDKGLNNKFALVRVEL